MIKVSRLLLPLLFLVFTFPSFAQRMSRPKIDLSCKHVSPIEQSYLARHISFNRANSNLEARSIDQFIKKLDRSKIYLLKSDVKDIKKKMKGIFKKTRGRDCSPIKSTHQLFVKRVGERLSFVRKELGKKFKFNPKTKFTLDPDHRKYPKTKKEAQAFHRKYLQFQIGNYIATEEPLEEAKHKVIRSYERIFRRVKEYDDVDLWALYLDAFSRSLDPHSSYLSRDALEDFEIQMKLSLEGIGASLSSRDGFTVIEQLIPGGAASKNGKLKPKDKIVAVGQGAKGKFDNVIEMDLRDVVRKIRGKKGTKVRLSILRKEGKKNKRLVVTLVRDKVKLDDDAASIEYIDRKVKGQKQKIGLINLPSFYADNKRNGVSAAKDMKKLLKDANKKKADAIVLDLSTNGGGSLDDAVKIAGLFFKTGNVVKQSHRDPNRGELELADEDPAVDWSGPLVILISRISASASEIVAGALQDYKRAIVVGGDHTFGKGSVQSVEPLPPGLGALKTTVGMFFIPGGNSTQHRGVTADIPLPSTYSTDEIGEKTLDYSLPPKKVGAFISKAAYVTSGPGKWEPVNKKLISDLKSKSAKRVKKSEDFAKIRKNIKKAAKRGRTIDVAEILGKVDDKKGEAEGSEEEKDDGKVLSRKEKKERYFKRADIQEALNIAVDYLAAKGSRPMTIGKKLEKDDKPKN